MYISAEERMMYKVMKALYDSGIPISFKGSMVLKACLMEAGYYEDTRHTVDIDGNWYSDKLPSAEQMVESIQSALDENNILLNVGLYRMYGEKRSAGFELKDKTTNEIIFTMDIDVNRPTTSTKIYEVDGVRFRGVLPVQMIADKVSVISTDKVFRRIKDVIDMYYISQTFELDVNEVYTSLDKSGRVLGTFDGFLNRTEELKHSYDKFRFVGKVDKPVFEEVYSSVKEYISEIIKD